MGKANTRKRPRRNGAARRNRGADRREALVVGIVIAVVVGAAALGAVVYYGNRGGGLGAVPVEQVEAGYPVRHDGGTVVAGDAGAPAEIGVYLDFLCPGCGQLEQAYGDEINARLRAGDVRVLYHLLPMLNDRSDPPGYSMEAANAAHCAVDAGPFPSYLASLFAGQPAEGGPGYTTSQLVDLGRELGADGPEFQRCVQDGRYDDAVTATFETARETPDLQVTQAGQTFFRGTPTVTAGGEIVDYSEPGWLDGIITAARRQ